MIKKLFFMSTLPFLLMAIGLWNISARAGEQWVDSAPLPEDMTWDSWSAGTYTLLDDGPRLWIGTGTGLLSWDKAAHDYTRFSQADGLPHSKIFAAVIDEVGNRWFGGDGGLSKMAMDDTWTHYNTLNSGLLSDIVGDIAVSAGGELWVSYPFLDDISRLRADGTWEMYSSRQLAVQQEFMGVKETLNANTLWTVAGDEVWIGYEAYDGTQWHHRQPADSYWSAPLVITADSKDQVWALEESRVWRWDQKSWSEYNVDIYWSGSLSALAVGADDSVWVGGYQRFGNPYTTETSGVALLPPEPGSVELQPLDMPPPVSALLPSAEGLWAAGTNWLLKHNGATVPFTDVPFLHQVNHVIVNRHGYTWVQSSYKAPYTSGVVQVLDDQGTAPMWDDSGELRGHADIIHALAVTGNGDLWLAGESDWRARTPIGPYRYHGQERISFFPEGGTFFVHDIFSEDEHHTWFVYQDSTYEDGSQKTKIGVYGLDDSATTADPDDDVWTQYPFGENKAPGVVAAHDGRLWYGDSTGVYLYQESAWKKLNGSPAINLIPAANGTLFVNTNSSKVLVIEPGGQQYLQNLADLIEARFNLIRTTRKRNRLWTVAPDGAVWYWQGNKVLGRRDDQGLQIYNSPVSNPFIEVDENNHVWLVSGADLWRMAPEANFRLSSGPAIWFVQPNNTYEEAVSVRPIRGFNSKVQLLVRGLPEGITAELQPSTVMPGETALITLTVGDVPLGENSFTLSGASDTLLHEKEIVLAVTGEAHELWFPAFLNP
jgi:hypothetical protein